MTAFLRSFVAHQRHCKNSSLDVASYDKPWFGILEIRSHIATNRTRAPKTLAGTCFLMIVSIFTYNLCIINIFHVLNSDRFRWIWDASLFPNLSEVQSVTDDKKATAKSS